MGTNKENRKMKKKKRGRKHTGKSGI